MKERAFITGVSGFAGSHLAEHLIKSGMEVSGTYLSDKSLENVSHFKKVRLFKVNLKERESIKQAVLQERPDFIFHLAAQASPPKSFDEPIKTLHTNIDSQINLLETVRKVGIKPRILIVGSADEYGLVKPGDNPVDEETELRPTNPYSVSKIAQDFLGFSYFKAYKLDIVRVRPFNHIGPRQSPDFVVSSFGKQIAEIEKGIIPAVIKVGDLSAVRDFTAVSDMVWAYRLAVEKGTVGEVYNIGSGIGTKIKEVLNILLSFSKKKISVETDFSRIRPIDIPELVCDSSKFRKRTGWEPRVKLAMVLKSVLDYWRGKV